MIYLKFEEPTDTEWTQWKTKCEEETKKLIETHQKGVPIKIKSLYSEQKHRYYDYPFNGKCAYCESSIEINSPNYVEHFRPKSEVRDMNNKIINKKGSSQPHPGYYWLAYKWENLLPTCWNCNTRHEDKSGTMVGKGNRFPLANQYAETPGEEIDESPLLINPLFEEPSNFLYIDKLGVIHSKDSSQKGDTTINIFGLNTREPLVTGRKKEYENIYRKLQLLYLINDTTERNQELQEIGLVAKGGSPYTIAARKAITDVLTSVKEIQDSISKL